MTDDKRKSPVINCPNCKNEVKILRYTKHAIIHEYFCPWCNAYIGDCEPQEQRSKPSSNK